MIKRFLVSGMSCSNCALGIEKALNRINGVIKAEVSLMNKCLTAEFDENLVPEILIISTVEKLGYGIKDFSEERGDNLKNILKKRFTTSLFFLIPLIYFSMGNMIGLPIPTLKVNLIIQCLLALIIIMINFKFYINGAHAVINLSPNMDTLVALGSFASLTYSVVVSVLAFINPMNNLHAFYESSAMVLVLVTLGKWLEEISKQKTGDEIEKLSKLIPSTAKILKEGKEVVIPVNQIAVGDVVVLRIGDYSPVDGDVVKGNGSVDKSAITGESLLEEILEGSKVVSGSIIKTGVLYVKAQKVGKDTLFSEIVEIVRSASASKASAQKLADKISSYFVPTVALIALITFNLWTIFSGNLYLAFKYSISVLVISCPCALGLATPVAIMATTGHATNFGVLYKNAEAIEKLAKINCILFDKTATLTEGKPKVTDFINYSSYSQEEIMGIVSALENNANHPLANAMIEFSGESDLVATNVQNVVGKGIVGKVGGKNFYLGNFVEVPESETLKGKTVISLSSDGKLLCSFAIIDQIKKDSISTIQTLNKMGVKTVLVSGDNEDVATLVAGRLNIGEYFHSILPSGKVDIVKKYQDQGYSTAFCGDGINDSPALASADLGIAVGNGTDIAIDTANVVVSKEVTSIVNAVALSRRAVSIIKGNLFWAFIYNVIFIPVAAGGLSFIGISFSPIIASMLMCISSLCVVLNALRIRRFKNIKEKEENGGIMKVKIEGMMCKHCEKKVFDTLTVLEGVEKVEINLKKKFALIKGSVNAETIKQAIENAGYGVEKIET